MAANLALSPLSESLFTFDLTPSSIVTAKIDKLGNQYGTFNPGGSKINDVESNSEDENDGKSEEEDDGGGSRKRRRVSEENKENPLHVFCKLKREYNYTGTFHGNPSGCQIL